MPPRNKSPLSAKKRTVSQQLQPMGFTCQAYKKVLGCLCDKPAVSNKRVCAGHGGLSTGPRTKEGLERLAASKTVHGRETRALRALRSKISHELRQLEEVLYAEGLIHGPRTRGRKPSLWAPTDGITEFFTKVS